MFDKKDGSKEIQGCNRRSQNGVGQLVRLCVVSGESCDSKYEKASDELDSLLQANNIPVQCV